MRSSSFAITFAVHRIRSIGDAQRASHGETGSERQVVGQAGTAEDLDGLVRDPLQHCGNDDLDRRDLGACTPRSGLIELPGGVEHLQARAVDGDPQIGDALAVAAEIGERPPEGSPREAPFDHQSQGPLGRSNGAHAVVHATRAEAPLGDGEALTELADQMVARHTYPLEFDLAMPGRGVEVAEAGEHAEDSNPWRVERNEDQAVTAMAILTVAGAGGEVRDADEEPEPAQRMAETGGPPLAPVEHELVAFDSDGRGEIRRIARGDSGLGHAERRADLSGKQRAQPALLLRRGAVVQEHLHVAAVRRVAVEDLGRQRAPAHRFGERGVVEGGKPGAIGAIGAVLRVGQEEIPQPGGARLLLQAGDERSLAPAGPIGAGTAPRAGGEDRLLERLDLVDKKGSQTLQQARGEGRMGEVHGRQVWPTWNPRAPAEPSPTSTLSPPLRMVEAVAGDGILGGSEFAGERRPAMRIGVPKETRAHERRVALTPSAVRTLVQEGHELFVESGAGDEAGHADGLYDAAGARIVFDRMEILLRPELITCVHPPRPEEYRFLPSGQIIFAFWGLPATHPEDLAQLLASGVTAIGLEAIEDAHGNAPILTSMSEIAGGLAVVFGAGALLHTGRGESGRGILLGGAPGVPPAHFVVLGAGVLGTSAARAALGLGAQVSMLDVAVEPLRRAREALGAGLTTMLATPPNVEKVVAFADVLVGAAAVHGQRAPLLVRREMLALMRPLSVILDLAIDMGGNCETSRPTSFPDPTYTVDDVVHFCVPNLPSVAARSATLALTSVQLPYISAVARDGIAKAAIEHPRLARGVYLHQGACVHPSLARVHGLALNSRPPWVEGETSSTGKEG